VDNKTLWEKCISKIENDIDDHDFNMWVRPLSAINDDASFRLHAPNRFIKDWLEDNLLEKLQDAIQHFLGETRSVIIELDNSGQTTLDESAQPAVLEEQKISTPFGTNVLNSAFTFENHVEGKSNQIARAATKQVSENPGQDYNPLFIYGGVGLGKTHLMHAAGNLIKNTGDGANVAYVHSERFVSDFVKALGNRTMPEFKNYYRSLDALLIDDIQFFVGKDSSQEEFFHTYNTDPPELETRVAILKNKALKNQVDLDDDVAFLVAKKIRSNVRELEGALHRLVASSRFTNRKIDLDLAKDTLQDLTLFQERKISIENIQKTVADFYSIRVFDLKSKRRNRQIARPRQIAMALAKELTSLSLPDIGDAFGGRDHTTVIHACKKVVELTRTDSKLNEDYVSLLKILSV